MHSFLRSMLFAFFVALFVIGAPAVVLYTAGYRYNSQNGQIVRTGALSVSSTPRGATITWSATESVTTPYVYNRVIPGTYQLTIEKEGYHSVGRKISVSGGKTTYLSDVFLFAQSTPSLLIEEDADVVAAAQDGTAIAFLRRAKNSGEIWRYDIDNGNYALVAQFPAEDSAIYSLAFTHDGLITVHNAARAVLFAFTRDGASVDVDAMTDDDAVTLIDNGQAVEVHANGTLVALLPSSTYTVAETDRSYAVITDMQGNLHFFDMASSSPLLLSTNATSYDWNRTLGRLTWTKDEIELNSFDVATRATTFVTRQSATIIGATWHSSRSAMLAATSKKLVAVTFENDIVQGAQPLADMAVTAFWASEDGRYAYLFGEYESVRGLYRLQLK